jgi:FSR family fosmidomycin resistance protein-like MFS transporter
MVAALSTFLPTFLSSEGANLLQAGGAFSIVQMAGAAGSLTSGTVSDRLGRRRVLTLVLVAAPVLMFLFLAAPRWATVPMLLVAGFTVFSANPVMMALVQEYGRDHPATANGLYMALVFASQSLIIILVGAVADRWGLRTTFYGCALLGFAGLPFVRLLPKKP